LARVKKKGPKLTVLKKRGGRKAVRARGPSGKGENKRPTPGKKKNKKKKGCVEAEGRKTARSGQDRVGKRNARKAELGENTEEDCFSSKRRGVISRLAQGKKKNKEKWCVNITQREKNTKNP